MISCTLLSFSLLLSMLSIPAEAAWFRHGRLHLGYGQAIDLKNRQQSFNPAGTSIASTIASESYTFSVPNASIVAPSLTSQGMAVASIVPLYEVCNTPGSNTTSCSTVFETITTTTCSTVLTHAFSATTITECALNITFSTQSSYALATTTILPSTTPAQKRQVPTSVPTSSLSSSPTASTETYVQSVVSYWYAPWQSLAANNPQDITLRVCTSDFWGHQSCTSVQEVWIVHTEYVPVSTTSTLIISTSLSSDAVFLLAPTQSVTASAGNFTLSTQVVYSSVIANATTSVSTLDTTTLTTTSTSTITITAPPTTITMTLSATGNETVLTTEAYLSTTVVTSTMTVTPMKRRKQARDLIEVREETLAEALLLD